jgi:sortase A
MMRRAPRAYAVAAVAALVIGIACLGHSAWIHAKALVAQRLIEAAWQRTAQGDVDAKPWSWADTRPVAKLFLGRDSNALMVLEGSSGRNLAFGPTHDPASVLPGDRGNSVIEGHRDTHFGALRELRVGDVIRVELPRGRRESFVVAHLRVVDSRYSRISLESDTPRLTLVTCYPFDAVRPGGPLRYVVVADQMSESNKTIISVGSFNQPVAGQFSGFSSTGMYPNNATNTFIPAARPASTSRSASPM